MDRNAEFWVGFDKSENDIVVKLNGRVIAPAKWLLEFLAAGYSELKNASAAHLLEEARAA